MGSFEQDKFEEHYKILFDFMDGHESDQIELENVKGYLKGFFKLGLELKEKELVGKND